MEGERTIQVHGLADLQKALRQIERTLPKELGFGLAEAAKIVADAARPKVPHRTGAAQASIKVRKQQRSASLAVGGTKAPYYPWLDFGGTVGPARSIRRQFIPGGRYIFPTLKQKDAEVKAKVDDVIARLAKQAGFETEGEG